MYVYYYTFYIILKNKSETIFYFIKDEINNEKSKNIKDKINYKILYSEKKDENYYINKINELENNVKTLENNIKNFELKLKEKERIINEEKLKNENLNKIINEFQNKYKNELQINRISELENEIKQLKSYILSPGEKLIFIKFISVNQKIDFSTVAKINDIFMKIETIFYNNYPNYKDIKINFLIKGKKINRNKTIEENNIKNNDILTLSIIDNNE